MHRIAVLVLLCFAAGCSTTARVQTGDAATVTSSSAYARIESRSLAAVLLAGMFIAAAAHEAQDPRPFPSPSALFDFGGRPAPELAPGRAINEQDCTRPIDLSAGNLRCR